MIRGNFSPEGVRHLQEIRSLVRKPVLTIDERIKLIVHAEKLANYAKKYQRGALSQRRVCYATEQLAMRFLIISTLYEAYQVMGGRREWWPTLLRLLPTDYTPPAKLRSGSNYENSLLAEELSAALALYKTGSRPSDEQIQSIAQKLFLSRHGPRCFKQAQWDFWRIDGHP